MKSDAIPVWMVGSYFVGLAGIALLLVAVVLGLAGVHMPWLPVTAGILTFGGLGGRYILGQMLHRRMHHISEENLTTVYMPLRNEGVDAWRPVEAMKIGELGYLVTENSPDGEEWAFQPGQILQCEKRELSEGTHLVVVRKGT